MISNTVTNKNSQIYYKGNYWNDLSLVLEYMSENFTGDKNKWWVEDFLERFAQTPFEIGLVLNCGNGWVERELIDKNIVKKIIAFDYSMDLLRIAKTEKNDRPISYFLTDVNKIDFRQNQFDLIINVASLHHVQFINRICFILAKALKADGILINYDYIGPHRNQYPIKQWQLINKVNRTLPNAIKKNPLKKPHLPTMLATDPTEAIHSELIIESISRYFKIFERYDSGGGIAYELLTHNPKLQTIPEKKLNIFVAKILEEDKKYTLQGRIPPLFSYFLAKPNKAILKNGYKIEHFQSIEDLREKKAMKRFGIYSWGKYLQFLASRIKVRIRQIFM